jgi:hypothetical protein
VDVRAQALDRIKGHLLGRNETGTIREPEDAWSENPQVLRRIRIAARLKTDLKNQRIGKITLASSISQKDEKEGL